MCYENFKKKKAWNRWYINKIKAFSVGCGGRIRTCGLRVMSPTSYQAALLRDMCFSSAFIVYTFAAYLSIVFLNFICSLLSILPFCPTMYPICSQPSKNQLFSACFCKTADKRKNLEKLDKSRISRFYMVRVARLELTASWPPVKRATNCATPGWCVLLNVSLDRIAHQSGKCKS